MSGFVGWLRGRLGGAEASGSRPPPPPRRGPGKDYRRYREPRSATRFGMRDLETTLGVPASELRAFRPSYSVRHIAKRSGGHRVIHAPDAPTKRLQRRILRRLLAALPTRAEVHGFERGRSIASNAAPHVGRAVVLRMDLAEFFTSTRARRIRRLFRVLGWDAETAELLTRLTTLDGGLPTGAPTSPRLANLVNVRLDARLAALAEALGATYTRYADDLTFSFERDDAARIHDAIAAAKRVARQNGYTLHEQRKLRIRRRHERQVVTGLVVNERLALPRARRRWLRAVEHHVYTGRPATITPEQLTGWHALEHMLELPETPRAAPPATSVEPPGG